MKKVNTIPAIKLFVALLLVGATQISLASFTGSSEGKSKGQFSLKEFNKTFYRSANPFSLRTGFEFKGSQILNQKKDANGSTVFTSIMRFEKGNTTYIYPYKHKVAVPKFVTPKPPSIK